MTGQPMTPASRKRSGFGIHRLSRLPPHSTHHILAGMKNLQLTMACWDYDRTRMLMEGRVAMDGIDLTYLNLVVEETFFRMLRYREFDIAEMSLSSYVLSL